MKLTFTNNKQKIESILGFNYRKISILLDMSRFAINIVELHIILSICHLYIYICEKGLSGIASTVQTFIMYT